VVDVALCLLKTRDFLFPSIGLYWTAAAAGKRVGRGRDWRRTGGPCSPCHGATVVAIVEARQHQVAFFALLLLARDFVEDTQPSAASARSIVIFLCQRLSFMFHPPVLKPDFDLPFGQVQRGGNLDPPRTAEVFVEVELFF
jgi:hypothetical protein